MNYSSPMRRSNGCLSGGWITSLQSGLEGLSDDLEYNHSETSSLTSTNVDQSIDIQDHRPALAGVSPFQRQYKQYRVKRRSAHQPTSLYVEDYFQSLDPPPKPPKPIRPSRIPNSRNLGTPSRTSLVTPEPPWTKGPKQKPIRIRRPHFGKSLMELSKLNEESCDEVYRRQRENHVNRFPDLEPDHWDSGQYHVTTVREQRGQSPSKRQIDRIKERERSQGNHLKPTSIQGNLSKSTPDLWNPRVEMQESYSGKNQVRRSPRREVGLWENAQRYKGSMEHLLDEVEEKFSSLARSQRHHSLPPENHLSRCDRARALKGRSMASLDHEQVHYSVSQHSQHLKNSYQSLVQSIQGSQSSRSLPSGSRMGCYSDLGESNPYYDPDFPHIQMSNPAKAQGYHEVKRQYYPKFNNMFPSRANRFGYPVYPEREFGIPSSLGPVSFAGFSPSVCSGSSVITDSGRQSMISNCRSVKPKKKLNLFLKHFAQNF
ncbi:hypothetical protein TCAL_12543 [Tigriopus californicus]|uniref:Uncharacterized protein n=1 Tax=Tigriopus californicus TaxID=6832 RepID=A0A553PS68_TIGCA|nr:uncharacterized protein LOC131891389 [Tigriopus californicus]XP_059096916.1 uncharacterized protein LOC131891389 [Tigriopus californicus]TRY80527.1 hypothetical protein TCAL_12543 [Tigriopus californicus]|eukprot:TCALIF_12543-PA protein Name:"Protein of unknown function" AED:0.00 eAED:0.00 QI:38/1/0.66/1/1/0.66/3/0/485